MKKRLSSGFTFIEIMVVVTIMALTFGAIAVSFSSIQVKSRDSRRKADLESIRQALELCRTLTGAYPVKASPLSGNITCTDGTTVYLSRVPVDPKTKNGYVVTTSTATAYSIQATLENSLDADYPTYTVTQP